VEITEGVDDRIRILSSRTNNISKMLPKTREIIMSGKFQLSSNPSLSKKAYLQQPLSGLLTFETLPKEIKARFDDPSVLRPPQIKEIDSFFPAEQISTVHSGSCFKKYSNPEFFLQEWFRTQQEEQKILEAEKEKKAKGKQERKQQRMIERQSQRMSQQIPAAQEK